MNSVSSVAEREKGRKGERGKGRKEGKSEWGRGKSKNSFVFTLPSSLLPLPYKLSRSPFPILFLFLLSAVLLGCEEDVPIASTDLPFEVYGVLNPAADTQRVRVFPIEHRLKPNSGEPIDAVLTSTDLETGEVFVWHDSLVAYADGTYGHVFWAAFRPEGGHTYRVDVTRSDGARSSAVVQIPHLPDVLHPRTFPGVTLPVLFEGGVTRVRALEVEYWVHYGWCNGEWTRFRFNHQEEVYPDGEAKWVHLGIGEAYRAMVDTLSSERLFQESYGLVPRLVTLRAMVTGAWDPPGGTYDPEVLIEPGVWTNVENGFGFVGSGYYVERVLFYSPEFYGEAAPQLELSAGALEAAGFTIVPAPIPGRDACIGPRL